MNKELLPLCAVLNGNDYGTPKEAEHLLSVIDVSVKGGGKGKGRAPASRIERLLVWLSTFPGPYEALAEISRLIEEGGVHGRGRNEKRGVLTSQLWAGMQDYNITNQSSLALWFSGRKEFPGGRTAYLAELPEFFLHIVAQGLLAPLAIDALMMQRVLLIPQVENGKLPSSHSSAKAIRQSTYGILLHQSQNSLTQGRGGGGQVAKGQPLDTRVGGDGNKSTRGGRAQSRGRGFEFGGSGRGKDQMLPVQQRAGISHQKAATVQAQGSCTPICVEEYDRIDLNLKKNQVEAHQLRKPLSLNAVGEVSKTSRFGILKHCMNNIGLSSISVLGVFSSSTHSSVGGVRSD